MFNKSTIFHLPFHLQTEKQGRVFVCDSSAAVWSAAVRHGARTRGQHRNFRQRGQEGIPGWVKSRRNYPSIIRACFRIFRLSKIYRAHLRFERCRSRFFYFVLRNVRTRHQTSAVRQISVKIHFTYASCNDKLFFEKWKSRRAHGTYLIFKYDTSFYIVRFRDIPENSRFFLKWNLVFIFLLYTSRFYFLWKSLLTRLSIQEIL